MTEKAARYPLLLLLPDQPPFQIHLPGPGDPQLPRGHVLGDGGPGPDVSPGPHGHRRHQGGVAADKGLFADNGRVFLLAVVVAGDGPGPDVGAGPHVRIPQVGEVACLDAFMENRLLHFHEVAHMHPGPEIAQRPQMGAGPHIHPDAQAALGDDGAHLDINVVFQDGIDNLDRRLDAAVLADDGVALQVDVGIDDGVPADADERLDISGLRVDEADPLVHVPGVDPALHRLGGPGQLRPAVDPQQRLPVRVHQGLHPPARLPGDVDQVGEVDFAR